MLLVAVLASSTNIDRHAKRVCPLLGITLDSDLSVFFVSSHGRLGLFLVLPLEVCLSC